jgi:hypothetical protein
LLDRFATPQMLSAICVSLYGFHTTYMLRHLRRDEYIYVYIYMYSLRRRSRNINRETNNIHNTISCRMCYLCRTPHQTSAYRPVRLLQRFKDCSNWLCTPTELHGLQLSYVRRFMYHLSACPRGGPTYCPSPDRWRYLSGCLNMYILSSYNPFHL